jgi:nucleotide-binding universal stress UspA family protein
MLQSILLATDFRPASQAASQVAALLSSAFGSRVTVFHALEQTWPVSSQENQDLLLKHLAEQNVDVTNLLVGMGPPADTIVRKANEIDADLILIGAGELSRSDRFSAGPVATAVIEHALQPVLAVRPGEPAPRFHKILCPVDQSDPSGRGLRNAIRLARAFGGELIILTVVPEVSWLTAAVESGKFAGARAEYEGKWREEFDRFLAGNPTHEVKARTEVRHGKPHEQIIAAAREHQADVIVVGATGRTGLVRVLLGSTTRRLLEQVPCSLLVVKEEDVIEELFEGEVRLINLLLAEGRELLAAGAYEAARTKFRQVLAHNPFHMGAITGLADAHEKLGNADQARYYRRRAASLMDM